MKARANGEKLKYEDKQEIKYYVPPVHDLIKLVPGTFLSIYDLPGLNDSMTKDVYHHYVLENFKKIYIIIHIIDINSALNTSNEIDILKLILKEMSDNMEKYNIENKLICLLNKCNELEYDKVN